MKIFILFLTLLLIVEARYIDLGIQGATEKITEKDIVLNIKEKLSRIKQKDVERLLIASTDKRANVTSNLSACLKSNQKIKENIVKTKRNHYNFAGELIFEKGEEQRQNFLTRASVCVVDGSNEEIAKKSIEALLKIGNCSKVMVANADFRILQSKMNGFMHFYPFHEGLSNAMGIECLPSRSEAFKSSITINTISIEDLK